MKAMFGLLFGFGLALAVVIGQRLTVEDLSIVAGVAVGVVASMPVALVLVLLHKANERQTRRHLAGIAPQQAPEWTTGHPLGILRRQRARRACFGRYGAFWAAIR